MKEVVLALLLVKLVYNSITVILLLWPLNTEQNYLNTKNRK